MSSESTAHSRAQRLIGQLTPSQTSSITQSNAGSIGSSTPHPQSTSSSTRHWNGWGFSDTEFTLTDTGAIALNGHRYAYSGKSMPSLRTWMEARTGIDVNDVTPSQPEPKLVKPTINQSMIDSIVNHCHHVDYSDRDRLFHSHGHTAQEVFKLRFGRFDRVPDCVVYPRSHEDVLAIVRAANEHDCVVIPYGGGTSVTQALMCPTNEKRTIISLDMSIMSSIKWIDRPNSRSCIQAGAIGRDIERALQSQGLTLGHEPDSMEFSSMGGWVATRASGMRRNKYGNIDEIITHIKFVTPTGETLEKSLPAPRTSMGPDLHHLALGSEGMFGVVTEVTVRIHPKAECIVYGSVVFPNFEAGVAALKEVERARCKPVSIRLVDNGQFQFGQALKTESESAITDMTDKLKKWYLLNRLKFDVNTMTACTLLFEGSKAEVDFQQRRVYEICLKHGGIKGGPENGIRGYFLTYMIAYLRDFGFRYSFIAESFETSCSWDSILPLCDNTKAAIVTAAKQCGVKREPFISCRVTQLYETGVAVYFYFGFVWTGLSDPVKVFETIEHKAREAILANGGTLSHHHGVGKLRKDFLPSSVSTTGIDLLKGIKKHMDPKNVFAAGNLIDL